MFRFDTVHAKETWKYGKSLFATRAFRAGETVLIVCGPIVEAPSHYTIPIDSRLYVDPVDDVRFICHSCSPNCGIRNRTEIVAMADICEGDEILIDYAMIVPRFYEGAPGSEIKCDCGTKACRWRFMWYDEIPEAVKEAYAGYVSEYLIK